MAATFASATEYVTAVPDPCLDILVQTLLVCYFLRLCFHQAIPMQASLSDGDWDDVQHRLRLHHLLSTSLVYLHHFFRERDFQLCQYSQQQGRCSRGAAAEKCLVPEAHYVFENVVVLLLHPCLGLVCML